MKCPGCGHENTDKIGFGTVCDRCLAWLHTCGCCRLYNREAGRCRSSTTEYSGPPDLRNYCDEFTPVVAEGGNPAPSQGAGRFESLFRKGDDEG